MNSKPSLPKPESDAGARQRAVEETGRSFVVEASAGTGKTHTLLDRILHLVLEKGPGGEPAPLSRICAITFTEKAAGEMKVRLRQRLEQVISDKNASRERLQRARGALDELETAAISTFHSFAVSLLKERPIEAGLDPRFSALDETQSELFFRDAWDLWIGRAIQAPDPTLERALRNGFSLENLKKLAQALRGNWLSIRGLECDAPPSEEHFLENVPEFLERGRAFHRRLRHSEDKLAACLENALDWLSSPRDADIRLSKPGNAGSGKNWDGGKDTLQAVKEFLREMVEFQESYKKLPAQRLLFEVVSWIANDFMRREWEKKKLAQGLLDFDDQLRLARDLLLTNKAVRREFQLQFKTLLVDEFQDTDPIQWEMVLLLSSADIDESDFAKLHPEPGRLFIVGDPKQSIYRFRNADIETYLEIVDPPRLDSLGLEQLKFSTNFRSVPSILRFADAAFENAMRTESDGSRYQPGYLAFGGQGGRKTEMHSPSVSFLGDTGGEDDSKRTAPVIVRREAMRVARLIRDIQGSESWPIQDSAEKGGAGWRPPQYGDIAVLLPVLTHASVLEDALRELEVPYVLEGGKFYYTRSEVSSAITALRAIANPNDAVALYGTLRSIFFGLSDADLLRARIERRPFDYRENAPAESALQGPFAVLRELHRQRHTRPASETFEALLQDTGVREVLAVRGFQSLANLNKLGRTLRGLQGDRTFSQAVELLSTMDEEGLSESESRLMEERSNAVRIMTIHKSKGLDFPVTIVAALGLKRRAQSKRLLADPRKRKIFALISGPADSGMHTPRWKELAEEEKRREEAELVRLLYVGLTRAKDHLVLSTHSAGLKKEETSGQWIPETKDTRLSPIGAFLEECYSGKSGLVRMIDVPSLDAKPVPVKKTPSQPEPDWQSIISREYDELQSLRAGAVPPEILKAAAGIVEPAGEEDRSPEERTPEAAGNRSVRLGVAFHEAMELVDFSSPADTAGWVEAVAVKHRLDPSSAQMLRSMMRATLSSELLDRVRAAARSGKRILRELPFVRPVDSMTVEEGKIDLLFEEDGGWVLVDYKTDWVSERAESAGLFFRGKYAGQIAEYVAAMKNLNVQVGSALLLLARTGETIRMV